MTEYTEATKSSDMRSTGAAENWSSFRRNYFLALLCAVAVCNFIDRQIVSILLEPIKAEFHASDTEMGLLTGLIFASFYILGAIPVARLADRYSRKWVIAVCLLLWSVLTSLGGLAQNFRHLALSRLGVAFAEGGALPISQSIITDLYPLSSRARAFAILLSAQALGVGISVFLGGWLSEHFGWRSSFLVVGVPGVLLAALIIFTVKDPPRGLSDRSKPVGEAPPIGTAFKMLWNLRSYRYLVLTTVFGGMAGVGFLSWGPAFLMRVHEMSPVRVGGWFGVTVSTSLIAGALIGGVLGDRLGRRGIGGYVWVATVGPLLSVGPGLLFAFSPDWRIAVGSLFLWSLLLTSYQPICVTIAQSIVPIRIRATAAMVLTLGTGFVGTGMAPVLIGALNDLFEPSFGADAIRLSLAITSLFAAAGALCALLAMRSLQADHRAVHGVDYPSA
ncbi:MFS transporter [Phenylobacterium sp. LjRoot219]|uniref:spinster family MFS transporter n=1 Tax=Phenylobacterium sp. LjRoot219 TaxID=3342283 RepID=UPI003ECD37FC